MKREIAACLLLALIVLVHLVASLTFLDQTFGEILGFRFMRQHLALGESPRFILDTAGQGLPQTLDVLVTWRPFQLQALFSIVLILGLVWLAFRFHRLDKSRTAAS